MAGHAIIGCGRVSSFHAAAAKYSEVSVSYLVDTNLDRARSIGDRWCTDANCSTEILSAINDKGVTSASICLPHHLHADVVRQCLLYGLDVLVEKPFGTSALEISKLFELARQNQCKLLVCYQHTFDPTVRLGLELVRSGKIGRLIFANAHCFCKRKKEYYSGWRGSLETEGGSALINQGIHALHLLFEAVPDLSCVSASSQTIDLADSIDTEETLAAQLFGDGGMIASLHCSNVTSQEWDSGVHFVGTEGELKISLGSMNRLILNGKLQKSDPPEDVNLDAFPSSYYGWNHIRLFREFFASDGWEDAMLNHSALLAENVSRAVELIYANARRQNGH